MQLARIFVAVLLSFSFVIDAQAASVDARGLAQSFREVVKKTKPAVVYIEARIDSPRSYTGYEAASGSGVIIDAKKGYVLTAAHVIEQAAEVVVSLEDGRKFTAKEMWTDKEGDIGLIKIASDNLPEARLGDSDALEVGDWVLAIGSPFGKALENSVSAGIVSAKGRQTGILGAMGVEDFIQTDAVINRGNSGGPLINLDGEVVGINSNIISASGMNAGLGFAVPSKLIRSAIEQLITTGKVSRGYMGVSLASLSDLKPAAAAKLPDSVKKRGGAYLANIIPGGPADEAGLQQGDIILSFGEKSISNASELIDYIRYEQPGKLMRCKYWRNGKEYSAEVLLAERPSNEQVLAESQGDANTYAYRTLGIMASDWAGSMIDSGRIVRIRGMMVDYVRPGSIAHKAGLKGGDFIEAVDNIRVRNGAQFETALKEGDLRKGIYLKVLNLNEEKTIILKK